MFTKPKIATLQCFLVTRPFRIGHLIGGQAIEPGNQRSVPVTSISSGNEVGTLRCLRVACLLSPRPRHLDLSPGDLDTNEEALVRGPLYLTRLTICLTSPGPTWYERPPPA